MDSSVRGPVSTRDALDVIGDIVREIAPSTPLDVMVGCILRAYADTAPDAFDDVPPPGFSEGASVRIVASFAARGMLLPRAPERKAPCDVDEILRAVPEHWVSARTVARRLGFKSEHGVALAPTVPRGPAWGPTEEEHRLGAHGLIPHLPFVTALDALVEAGRLRRERVDHAGGLRVRYIRRPGVLETRL